MTTATDDTEVVQAAATAAENVIFSRYTHDEVRDLDVTVTFEDEQLEIDIYLDAPGDVEEVAQDAMLAARNAADEIID